MEIYLIRHTTPLLEKGVCYGQSDIPLASTWETEMKKLMETLPSQLDAVYTSPASRCSRLAQLLNSKTTLKTDERLKEMNFGEWELKKWDELEQTALQAWMEDFVNTRVPKGENFTDLHLRVQQFIDQLLAEKHSHIAIVTHAGVIRSFVAHILEIPLQLAFRIRVDYSSITKIHLQKDHRMHVIDYLNRC
jgi:alpha-ribazole phosphatase